VPPSAFRETVRQTIMAVKRDYYELLGVERNAPEDDIRKAFRKLAFQYHPDRNPDPDATERFKEINEAYEVLSDTDKRAAYDRYGHDAPQAVFGRGAEGFDFGLGDIFEAFFGGTATGARQAPEKGQALHYGVSLTLEEAAAGVEKEIPVTRIEYCGECQGTGAKSGTQPVRCQQCNGTGQIRRVQANVFGRFTNVTTCPQCRGEGRVITDPCPKCKGAGRERKHITVPVKIPPGVASGMQVRVRGEGNAGHRGGPSGDLFVSIEVQEHAVFRREGDDILYDLDINFAQAALGVEMDVPTLDGNTKLKIPSGTQGGAVFRLRQKGMPHVNDRGRGDELVTVAVVTPDTLSKEQRLLFEKLAESLGKGKAKTGRSRS